MRGLRAALDRLPTRPFASLSKVASPMGPVGGFRSQGGPRRCPKAMLGTFFLCVGHAREAGNPGVLSESN